MTTTRRETFYSEPFGPDSRTLGTDEIREQYREILDSVFPAIESGLTTYADLWDSMLWNLAESKQITQAQHGALRLNADAHIRAATAASHGGMNDCMGMPA